MLHRIRAKVFNGRVGLLPKVPDDRDIEVGFFWAGAYAPKHDEWRLKPVTVKSQYCNTCGWNSSTGMKEIDEQEELDERSAVMFGRELGYINGDGFSTLRNNQKVIQKCGIAPMGLLPKSRTSWEDYSNPAYFTVKIREEAAKRRSKSYLSVNSVDDVYRALDDGRPVQIGVDWHSGYQGSGFMLPWIVWKVVGWLIGGHALYVYGYNQNYKGQKVFIVRNSFGRDYADNGDFYITEAMLKAGIDKYGAFINYDLDVDILRWLQTHQGNVVKGDQRPEVYLIFGDTKKRFPDLATLYSWGYLDSDIVIVDQSILEAVKDGENIDFWQGKHVKAIKAIIQQRQEIKNIFQDYFTELF